MPLIQWEDEDDIFEIDEMYLEANQRGNMAKNQL